MVAAPNGDFHVIFMAFKRGQTNWMIDGRFRDLNIPDQPARHGLTFLGFTTLASGNNASFGTLHDKPHAVAVVNPASPVGYDIYVSYTLFNGNPGGGKFQSQLFVARSSDGGVSFTTDKINQSTNENSGTWLVAGPNGQVFAFWRGFGSSPTIYFVKQAGWRLDESEIDSWEPGAGGVRSGQHQGRSDQPRELGTQHHAALERVSVSGGRRGRHDLRRVPGVRRSGHRIAESVRDRRQSAHHDDLVEGRRLDVDRAEGARQRRADAGARRPGLFLERRRDNNAAHPQLMPAIACGAGQCLVTYWESRTSALSANGWIGGYHRMMDLRGASLKADGTLGRSFQISRYPYRPGTKLVDPAALGADGKPLASPGERQRHRAGQRDRQRRRQRVAAPARPESSRRSPASSRAAFLD